MGNRMYLFNVPEIGDYSNETFPLMEWKYEFPLMLHPLFSGRPFIGPNCYNECEDGLYAEAGPGIEAMRAFYDFIERHAQSLVNDIRAFERARHRIFALLDERAEHAWFHLYASDVFSMSDAEPNEQALTLQQEIILTNTAIQQAIENDDPRQLDDMMGHGSTWAADFRELFNEPIYDFGWEPLSSMLERSDDGLEVFRDRKLYGLRRFDSGTVVVEPRYQQIHSLDPDSRLRVVAREDRLGYLDERGNEMIPCRFESVHAFREGIAGVRLEGRWSLIDLHGVLQSPCQFDDLEPLGHEGGLWRAKADGLWGVVDRHGEWRLPARYQSIEDDYDTYRMRDEQGNTVLYSKSLHPLGGNEIEEAKQIMLGEGQTCYRLRHRQGRKRLYTVVDDHGLRLLPDEYQYACYEPNTHAWVVRNGGFGIFDHRVAAYLLPCRYARIVVETSVPQEADSSRPLLVRQGKLWGLYRTWPETGWAIEPAYDHLEHVTFGILACCRDNRWGLIDSLGRMLRPVADPLPPYTAYTPGDWIAIVFNGARAWFVDRTGRTADLGATHAERARALGLQFGMNEHQLHYLNETLRTAGARK